MTRGNDDRIWVAVGLLILTVSVWYFSYHFTAVAADAQRAGCERGKLDRVQNARGWDTAADRVERAAINEHGALRVSDLHAALIYRAIAAGLHRRSVIDCGTVYPPPNVFGLTL